ncbi:LytR/AlgR family response regulator transcription factor [Chryseolinea soli]|uniref:DNA-binding response regulator n=1 Tax=Chryseolinea soli TaxID=2321403 RepID=A0A385SDY9_9BACT|nr:LytTR family DNA-binding domain-containing protein [Chryseolinea soli]AYB29092.1 DNA-binding response regulator [Chryseolinea soli]
MRDTRVIIVEDELNAAKNLKYLLAEHAPDMGVMATHASIEQATDWLRKNPPPSLGFFDIQLEDGLSFEIFKLINIDFPVIFTTAFNDYAIEAFKVNSIDYLLKPVHAADLQFSLEKFRKLAQPKPDKDLIYNVLNTLSRQQETSTLLVHFRDKIIPVPVGDFAFFFIRNNLVHGCTHKNQIHLLDFTFEALEQKLPRRHFIRANRQYIVNRTAIQEMELFFNGRLSLKLSPAPSETVLISKAKVPLFKQWMEA